jgi:hypothetical protein
METPLWQDLAEFKVSMERLPNGKFAWAITKTDGSIVANGDEFRIEPALTDLLSHLRDEMDDSAMRVLNPSWFIDVDTAFTTIEGEF